MKERITRALHETFHSNIYHSQVIKNSIVWELVKEPINVFPTEGGIKATFYL